MSHVYIKPRSPNLNGKVERSYLTDQLEFCQLLEYTDDVDFAEKLATWEEYYNVHRPHAGLKGLTLYEALPEKLYVEGVNRGRTGHSRTPFGWLLWLSLCHNGPVFPPWPDGPAC